MKSSQILGIGTDIVSHVRIRSMLDRYHDRFVQRILSSDEQVAFAKVLEPSAYMAKRFAAKEAVAKALGTGIGASVAFNEISVTNLASGEPCVSFIGKTKEYVSSKGQIKVWISLSDERDYSLAFAVITREA